MFVEHSRPTAGLGRPPKEQTRLRQSRTRLLGRRRANAQRARVHSPVAILAAMLVLAVGSPLAAAKTTPSPGVHIDPGSPVAKEYGIPLAEARGGGTGTGSGSGQLFGRGITRAPASAPKPTPTVTPSAAPGPAAAGGSVARTAPAAKRTARPRAHHAAPAGRARGTEVAATPATQLPPLSRPAATTGTGIAWMLGVAALVLALGGLGGAVLARHGRRTSARTS